MNLKTFSLAAAALLALPALAQSAAPTTSNAKPSAYANPYQGTANPSDDPIVATPSQTTDDTAVPPAPTAPAPVAPAKPSAYITPTAQPRNPDDGIVTVPVPDDAPEAAGTPEPRLKSHGYNPDSDIVTAVAESPNQLSEGTPFHARLVEELAADTTTPGTPFSAQLTQDVLHMGTVAIPAGSYIHGRVTYVSEGRRIGGQSTIRLTPDEVVLPDGTHYHFRAIVTQTAGSHTRVDSEGYAINKDHPVRTASEYGMAAGSGAIIGAVVAGPVGAGVGGAIGAGVMTVHWLRERNAAVLPANSQVTFSLSTPLALTPNTVPTATSYSAPPPTAAPAYVEPKIQN